MSVKTGNSDRFHVSEETHNYNDDRIHACLEDTNNDEEFMRIWKDANNDTCLSGKTHLDGSPFMCVWEDTDNDDTDRACLGRHR